MKKVYEMIDGIALHKHLKNGSVENKMSYQLTIGGIVSNMRIR